MSQLSISYLKEGSKSTEPLLEICGITVKQGAVSIINNFSFSLYKGDQVKITGPNGSGKTTLLNAIAGIGDGEIVSGDVFINGKIVTEEPTYKRVHNSIIYMTQLNNIFSNLTVKDNLIMALGPMGPEILYNEFPEWNNDLKLNKIAGQLSGGQIKKLALVMSLGRYQSEQIVMLDEPTAGLQGKLPNMLEHVNLIMITHD
ncbi:MAG TPA: ATP-binding cassette domain-containing protein [Thioploca sp.]|nr:ATP-binding cassette domain-containing protein [Thioploca sp.]